jgi:hypothetical protein
MNEVQYYLGRDDFDRYEIIEHNSTKPAYSGKCVFSINENSFSNGCDRLTTVYDFSLYLPIGESIYHTVNKMFLEAVQAIENLDKGPMQPVDRELQTGDHFFYPDTGYNCVKEIEDGETYVDYIDSDCRNYASIFRSQNLVEDCGISFEDLQDKGFFIHKDAYNETYRITTEAIKDIMAFLKNEFLKA